MKKNILVSLFFVLVSVAHASDIQVAPWKTAADVPGVPVGTVITKEYANNLARNIYVWGWPIVNSFNRRTMFSKAPEPGLNGGVLPIAPVGYVSMLSDYISPEQHWVAHPNQDVIYGFGFGAVDKDPVVLQVPDFGDRFWVYAIYDARTNEFSRLGKQYGTKPGNYLIVGPNWKGKVPSGIRGVLHAPTEFIAMGPRIFVDDSSQDKANIQSIINQVVIYPLSKYDNKIKTVNWKNSPIFPANKESTTETVWVDPNTFFDQLPGILEKVPPLPGEESVYAQIKSLLAAAKTNPELAHVIKQAAIEADKEIVSPLFDFQTNGVKLASGWTSPPNVARWGYDYATRTATAKSNMYVNQPSETRYFFIEVDEKGMRLNGDDNNAYTLTFPKNQTPPVNGFWSLTMYNAHHFFEKNDINRYSVGTKNLKKMKFNKDGSLTIYIQHNSPGKEKETNWLPAPNSNFEMTIRTYWPMQEVNKGLWTPPPVVKLH